MENASKALLMSAGILIGILILALMITLFASARDISSNYDQIKNAEAVQQFNTNFTKYLGQDLTIHEVVTICNFASEKEVTISGAKTKNDISNNNKKYKLTINSYSDDGYVNFIGFTEI